LSPPELPHDINGLVAYQSPLWMLIVAGLCGLVVAALLFFYLKKRWPKKQKSEEKVKAVDPVLASIRSFKSLEPMEPFHRKAQIEFFFQLSLAFREYLEIIFGVHATDMTTSELKSNAKVKDSLSNDTYHRVMELLEQSDMIKFAEQEVTVAQAKDRHQEWIKLPTQIENLRQENLKRIEALKPPLPNEVQTNEV